MQRTFDYVIVGAGSAGCVLANRLSADPNIRVLLLEAGRAGDQHPYVQVPIGLGMLWKQRMFDWGYESDAEEGLGGRRLPHLRGKVLGGSSCVNVMAFTRGHPGDYDRWARDYAPGWAYADVLPFFKRVESWEGGASAYRGDSGPIGVQFARPDDPLVEGMLAAGIAAGHPVTDDYNGERPEGIGRAQFSIHRGRRSSAARGYLRPAMRRRNLTVRTGALVHRVVVEKQRARAVQFSTGRTVETVEAEGEILLCGGAFNTPQMLMLSGIGPADELASAGIAPIVDLPVGRNLQDHACVHVQYRRRTPGPFHRLMRADRAALGMARAYLTGSGPATILPGGLHAFLKSDAAQPVPDIEFLFRSAPLDADVYCSPFIAPYTDGYQMSAVNLHPQSRGSIRLQSADPSTPVRIHFAFLTDGADIANLRTGLAMVRALGEQPALAEFRGAELSPGPAVRTAQEIDDWIRASVRSVSHPAGTCPMGTGDHAVLDPQLRVRGVDRLRVVDASAMPDLVSAHINACVLMMAERAAEYILSGG